MGTPGACGPASGFSLEKKPPLLPPRARPGDGAGTSVSLLLGETLWILALRVGVPRPKHIRA